jgi:hypothetical protein
LYGYCLGTMKIKAAILCLIATLIVRNSTAQVFDGQDVQLLISNMLFGSASTGFGAVLNKNKTQKTWPVFWKAAKAGALGGTLLFAGKKCSYLIYNSEDNIVVGAWSSKLIHNAGASIMENAALHKPIFSHYNLYIGFLRLEFDWNKKFAFTPRVMPLSLSGFIYSSIAYHGKFDVSRSLQMGTPYFRTKQTTNFLGIAIKGNVTIVQSPQYNLRNYNEVSAHENGHVLQGNEYYIFNTYFQKPSDKLKSKSKVINRLGKYIYLDQPIYEGLTLGLYNLAISQFGCYWKNPLEFEAERMAIGKQFHFSEYCR